MAEFKIGEAFVEVSLREPGAAEQEKVRRDTEAPFQKNPPKIPTQLANPVDAAFRQKLNSDLQAAARTLTKIPINPDTEQFRRNIADSITRAEKTLSADIPMDVADAAKWRSKVTALVTGVEESVKAKIPVETEVVVDEKTVEKSEGGLKKFALGAAAVLGPAGVIGGALAGTTALFAGLGATAAKGDQRVIDAYDRLWRTIANDTVELSKPILPSLLNVERQTEDTFRRMEPEIGSAMKAVAPEINQVAHGILGLAENAMPGLVTALQRSDPVVGALDRGLASLGTSVGGFLAGLSTGAPGAAAGLDAIFDDLDAILPPFGEFLGQVVDVTSAVAESATPAFRLAGTVLSGVADVIDHTSGVIGPLAAGALAVYAGFKVWSLVTSIVGAVRTGVGTLATTMGAETVAAETASVATTRLGTSMGVLRTGLGAAAGMALTLLPLMGMLSQGSGDAGKLADSLLQSGEAADKAASSYEDTVRSGGKFEGLRSTVVKNSADVKSELDQQLKTLGATDDQLATVNSAWDNYARVTGDASASTSDHEKALARLETTISMTKTSATALGSAAATTVAEGIDQASLAADQLDQSLRAVSTSSSAVTLGLQRQQGVADGFAADLALNESVLTTKQAFVDFNAVLKHHKVGSDEARQAGNQLLSSIYAQATAARQAAEAHYRGADAEGKTAAGARAYRQTLVELAAHTTGPLHQALEHMIGQLDQAAKPRTTDLNVDISNAEKGIATAKAQLATVPPSKRAAILADIAQLQSKIAQANHAINSLHSKTIGIDVNVVTHGNEIVVGLIGKGPHALAAGGVVKAVHGGVAAQIGEAGTDEGVIPLDQRGADVIGRALGPYLARRAASSTPAGSMQATSGGVVYNTYHVAVNVDAATLSDMQQVVGLFADLQRVARSQPRATGGYQ